MNFIFNRFENLLSKLYMMTIDYCSDSGSSVWSHGGAASLGLVLGQDLLVDVGSLLGLLEVGLDLTELGQVEGGDLLSLLDLLLVGLDLVLQLVNQLLHPLVVLVVLLLREGELLDAASCAPLGLLRLNKTALLVVELRLQVLDLLLQPGGDLPASLDSLLLRFVQLGLHVLHLVLQVATVLLAVLGVLLLPTKLISKTSSVDHGLLRLVLGNPALADHLLQIGLRSLHLRVELPLCSLKRLVLQSAVGELLHHVGELLLSSSSLTISVLQLSLRLLQLVGNSVVVPLRLDQTLPRLVAHDLLLLEAHLGGLDLVLVLLDGGLGVGVGTVGVLKSDAQLVHVSLQLL